MLISLFLDVIRINCPSRFAYYQLEPESLKLGSVQTHASGDQVSKTREQQKRVSFSQVSLTLLHSLRFSKCISFLGHNNGCYFSGIWPLWMLFTFFSKALFGMSVLLMLILSLVRLGDMCCFSHVRCFGRFIRCGISQTGVLEWTAPKVCVVLDSAN